MTPNLEAFLVNGLLPMLTSGIAIVLVRFRWDVSGWGSLGVGAGGWLIGFLFGASLGTVAHRLDSKNATTNQAVEENGDQSEQGAIRFHRALPNTNAEQGATPN